MKTRRVFVEQVAVMRSFIKRQQNVTAQLRKNQTVWLCVLKYKSLFLLFDGIYD